MLQIASSANVQVTATQSEIAQAQVHEEEKQRVLGMLPNFYVSYVSDGPRTTSKNSTSP